MAHSPETRQEALRLRVEEHLGLQEIVTRVGISKGTASLWLREHPLPQDELRRRVNTRGLRHGTEQQKKSRGEESEIHRVVRANKLGGVQVGKVSETAVLLRLLMQGFHVFGSMFDGDKTDWLVEVPATRKVWKVQVKTAKQEGHGLPVVTLRYGSNSKAGSRRYKEGDFDFLVGYNIYTDRCYVWAWQDLLGYRAAVSVHPDAEERWDKFIGA